MGECEVCGNRYDKAFDVMMQGVTRTFRQLRVRHPRARDAVQPLRLPDHRPRHGGRWALFLLRPLCEAERRAQDAGSNRERHAATREANQS